MKVKNISSKTSLSTIFILLITNIIFIMFVIVGYFNLTVNNHSLLDFFNWLLASFNSIRQDIDIFAALLIFIIIPVVFFIGLIGAIISRSKAIKKFNSKLNLKSVEFLQERINFKFNQPQCNLCCAYSEVENLEMIIHMVRVYTRYGSYVLIKEVELIFSLLNNKTFTLINKPINTMKFIYSIIDYSRRMKNFSYKFKGDNEVDTIKEKIEDYHKKGFKQILSKKQESGFKYLSILFFILSMFFLLYLSHVITEITLLALLTLPGIFLIISFIFTCRQNKRKKTSNLENIEKLLNEISNLAIHEDPDFKNQEIKKVILDKIEQILAIDPKNLDALYRKGLYHYNDYETTISIYEEIIKKEAIENLKEINDFGTDVNYNKKTPSFLIKIPCGLLAVRIIIALITAFILSQPTILLHYDNEILKIKDISEFQRLEINPQSEYDFLSKDQIFELRKRYVERSLFKSANYIPNEKVFGAIVDNKPWWGNRICQQLDYKGDYHENIEGDSKVSTLMNNPNTLVGLSQAYSTWDIDAYQEFCTSSYGRFMPFSLKYNEKQKLIVAEYELTKDFLNHTININNKSYRYPIQLSGLNALDFGFDYGYVFDSKNIKMFNNNNENITDIVTKFRDYIHLGSSCRYQGGCNNISPIQNNLMITVTDLPAEINIKLWKNKPLNKLMKADIYYRIIFREFF